MVVQSERLDWVGNFNWLLQQNLREFFCYRQHDDTTTPEFFEVLVQEADKEPDAAAVYCDCQYSGGRNGIEIAPSIRAGSGTTNQMQSWERVLLYIEGITAAPVRGLIRSPAIRQAGLVRSDEFRAPLEVFVWLAKILRWGNFRRVAEPLYYRLDHPRSFGNKLPGWSKDRKRAVHATLFTGLLDAAMPLCGTAEQRLLVLQTIVDQIVIYPSYRYRLSNEPNPSGKLMSECLERLKYEGRTHLLSTEELAPILQNLPRRLDEIKVFERSQMRRVIYRIRKRSRMAKVIYPSSRMRRVIYQSRHLLDMFKAKMSRLLLGGSSRTMSG
jgi:hypothetical protein